MRISIRNVKNLLLCLFLVLFLVFTGDVPYNRIGIMMVLLVSMAGISIITFKGKIHINCIFVISAIYFLYFLSDIYNGIDNSSNMTNFAICLSLIITFVQYIDDETDTYNVIRILFLVFLIAGPVIGIYQMVTGGFVFPETGASVYYNYKIFNSQQSNENYSALTMMIPAFLSIYFVSLTEKKLVKILLIVTTIVSFVCLLLTFSRGAIIGAIIAMIILVFSLSKYNKEIFKEITIGKLVFIIVLIIAVIVLYSYVEAFVNSLDVQKLLKKKTKDSLDVRLLQWKSIIMATMNSGIKNFFFGYGSNYTNVLGKISGYYISAHNIFLGHLIQNGIIGFLCVVAIFVDNIRKAIRIFKSNDLCGKFIAALVVAIWIAYQFVSMVRWELWISVIMLEMFYSSHYMDYESYLENNE